MPGVEVYIRDVGKALDGITAMQDDIRAATLVATKAAQNVAKRSIKSGMRGAPRWGQRGAIGRNKSEPAVNLHRSPNHMPRGGGIGKLTGDLRGAVGGVRRPKRAGSTYVGGVGCGGPSSITNLYRFRANGKFPFVAPGVAKAQPAIRAAYETAWAKASEM